MLLLFAGGEWMAPTLLPTRFGWGIAIPHHSNYSNDHAQNHLQIETLFPKEEKSHNQNKDCLHMAKYLKGDSCESTNAYELAEVGPYRDSTWKDYKYLQKPRQRGKWEIILVKTNSKAQC